MLTSVWPGVFTGRRECPLHHALEAKCPATGELTWSESVEPERVQRVDGTSSSDGKDGGNNNCNCFTEGTPVAMADGSTKAIEEVRSGDEVTTYNTDTGEQETHVVTGLFSKSAQVLLEITVDVSGSSGADTQPLAGDPSGDEVSGTDPPSGSEVKSFTVTPEHPFWQADEQTWTLAGDLAVGDELLQRDGDRIEIVAVETRERDRPFTVYNFTVDGTHNYYATAVDTLVHNCGPTENSKPDELPVELMEADFHGVSPSYGSDVPAAVAGGGPFLWALLTDGSLGIAAALPGIKHPVITRGAPVLAAGQIRFSNGRVASFDSQTGHYTPCSTECDLRYKWTGSDAFRAIGVNIPFSAWPS